MSADTTLVSDVVRRSAERWPERIALQDRNGSIRLTYTELWRSAERTAASLQSLGLVPGDRVMLAAEPGPSWMTSFLAISHAGLVAVPIPATTPPALVQLVAKFARIRVCICDRTGNKIWAALTGLRFVTAADLQDVGRALRAGVPGGAEAPPYGSSEVHFRNVTSTAVLVFTSGSTSTPRAVALSHAALRANLRSLHALRQADEDEALLSTLPPSHAYELVAGQLAPLAAGARIVYAGAPLPNRLVDTLRTQSITRVILVPALLEAMAREVIDGLILAGAIHESRRVLSARELGERIRTLGAEHRARLRAAIRDRIGSSFRVVTLGGAAADPAWVDILSLAGIDLDVGYGLTEAGPVVAMGRASACPPGSVGRPIPGVLVRIGPDDEVLVRTDAVMKGYAGDDAATAAAFDDDWLRTGDRGRIDAEGFLFITGRLKEAMVTPAGETIYPDEIEPFYASTHFAEFAVVPISDADGNDLPTLIVVPAERATSDDAIRRVVASLRAAAPSRLRVAGFIRQNEPLPRTSVGKIRRRELAADFRPSEVFQ